jgi:hypothetical protein
LPLAPRFESFVTAQATSGTKTPSATDLLRAQAIFRNEPRGAPKANKMFESANRPRETEH